MYQYECIHSPLRNQPRGDHGLSERGGGCQHSRIMREHGMRGNGLLGAQLTLECRFQWQAGVALVSDHRLDVQIRQSLTDFIQATARQSYVLRVILGIEDKNSHWSGWGTNRSSRKTLLPNSRNRFWRGNAIRLPKPPTGSVS